MTRRSPTARPRSRHPADAPASAAALFGPGDGDVARLARAAGAPPAPDVVDCAPMLAASADAPFSSPGWLFELKYDGVRVAIVRRPGAPPRLLARSGRDITASFPEIAAAAAEVRIDDCVVDGELIAVDARGTGSFEQLQQRLGLTNPWDVARASARVPVQVHAFDLPFVGGCDLRPLPLAARKRLLERLLPPGAIRYAEHVDEHGEALFRAACAHGGEGVVAKRADSAYASGRRSRDWIKIKAAKHATLAVVGFLPGRRGREALGSLMLAWEVDGALRYAGNVGSGLGERLIGEIQSVLEAGRCSVPAFSTSEPLARGAVFVEPSLIAEVRYTEVTARGLLRQPVLLAVHPRGGPRRRRRTSARSVQRGRASARP